MRMQNLIRVVAALLVGLASPVWAAGVTIDGSVSYRERMALPPDAWLTVTLVTLPTASPVAGASADIPAKGQVPISFVLNIHDALNTAASYGLVAEISSGGRVIFRNPVPTPVTPGAGQTPTIVVNYAPERLEEPPPPLPDTGLVEILWTVTSIGGKPVSGTRPLTLSIAADHRAGGSGGCNNYFTEASITEDGISFGATAATRMACAPQIMDQEAAYFTALAAVASYERDEQGLRLHDAAGVPLIGLVEATE
ncbi:META domain-containing protein [Devosia sp. XJ19-1]|uniref:META domain-containing protein n=1 Tax=Devosia ureilytica TaxID=2952754 RepID=A0A9Q4APY1_9HYPH|nr:META domain-containing protein [Devosia ureilytica]MCP8883973.1 META domain-containing protein [Devosia ureilytica]MCP8887581.1 META domain-containing protein [Devosia ureilytica]